MMVSVVSLGALMAALTQDPLPGLPPVSPSTDAPAQEAETPSAPVPADPTPTDLGPPALPPPVNPPPSQPDPTPFTPPPQAATKPARVADTDAVEDLPPVEPRLSPLATAGALGGGLLGLIPWVPVGAVCCTSAGVMALVYPATRGEPGTATSLGGGCATWTLMCSGGVLLGMTGWVLALTASVLGSLVTGAGVAVGAVGVPLLWGSLRKRGGLAAAAGAAAALAMMPLSTVGAALSGLLPWLSVALWVSVAPELPRNPSWVYLRWFALNALFMGAVTAGLGFLALGAVLPLTGSVGAFVVASLALPAE
jgi:hypothetical protein